MYKNFLEKVHNPNLAILFLRIAVGIVFINAGWSKIENMEGVIAFFASLGFVSFFAYLVAYIEFIGGIFVLAGVFSRYSGLLLAIIMLVATLKVHLTNGFAGAGGYEFTLVLLLISLAVIFIGDGKYSIGHYFKNRAK